MVPHTDDVRGVVGATASSQLQMADTSVRAQSRKEQCMSTTLTEAAPSAAATPTGGDAGGPSASAAKKWRARLKASLEDLVARYLSADRGFIAGLLLAWITLQESLPDLEEAEKGFRRA